MSAATGIHLIDDTDGAVRNAYTAAGWHVARVRDATTKAEVLDGFAAALQFPDYFGHNLDALWDCLTDLTRPTVVVWEGWQRCAVEHPEDWAGLMGVLRDRVDHSPAFAVLLIGTSPGT